MHASTLFWNLTVLIHSPDQEQTQQQASNMQYYTCSYLLLVTLYAWTRFFKLLQRQPFSPNINYLDFAYVTFYSLFFTAFSISFSVLIITCQSLLQLQIIRGNKQWNNYGRIIPCIGMSVLVGMFWIVVIFLQNILLRASTNPCQSLCIQNSTSLMEVENISIGIYFVFTLLPTSIIVIVTSVLSVKLFKKMSIQQKIQHYNNKKLLFMPILMVILIVCNGVIGYLHDGHCNFRSDKASGSERLPWKLGLFRKSFGFINCLHGVSYPITLLYFNTKLRKNWKKYFTRISNRVDSETVQ